MGTGAERNEFLRGPKWRTRTDPQRRHLAAAGTFALVVTLGAIPLRVTWWGLDLLGAPAWVVSATWWLPTAIITTWVLARPTPAGLTDDDDDTWLGYSIRWALVGEIEPRSVPVRLATAALFGAPVGWAVAVSAVATVTGLA